GLGGLGGHGGLLLLGRRGGEDAAARGQLLLAQRGAEVLGADEEQPDERVVVAAAREGDGRLVDLVELREPDERARDRRRAARLALRDAARVDAVAPAAERL